MKNELGTKYANLPAYQKVRRDTPPAWWEELGTNGLGKIQSLMKVPVTRLLGSPGEQIITGVRIAQLTSIWRNAQDCMDGLQSKVAEVRKKSGNTGKLTQERYDLKSSIYRSFLAGITPDTFNELLGVSTEDISKATIVDVCTGNGEFIAEVLPSTNTGPRAAIDISNGMLTAGEQSGNFDKAKSSPVQGDALRLPIADEVSDITVMNFGIDTVSNPKLALSELNRITKPDGKLVIITPLPLRVTSGGKRVIDEQDQIGSAVNPIEDLIALRESLRDNNLELQNLAVTSYYNLEVDGLERWNAFVLVCEKK